MANKLIEAIIEMRQMFSSDVHIAHGKINVTNTRGAFKPGHYNLGIPSAEDTDDLKKAKEVGVVCIDSRLDQIKNQRFRGPRKAVVAVAGGGVQPRAERRTALVNFTKEVHAVNPRAKVVYVGHDETCKGFDLFGAGAASRARAQGKEHEHIAISDELKKTAEEAVARGIPARNISLEIAEINDKGKLKKLRKIKWP
jgi:hypothetical protein